MGRVWWVVCLMWAAVACGEVDYDHEAQYKYVLVEDPQTFLQGENPGADIDAVALIKAGGETHFARVISESTTIPTDNSVSSIPERAQGQPDAVDPETGVCYRGGQLDHSTFVSLNGGHLVLAFGEEGREVAIEAGDEIHVFELDPSECQRFDEDPFLVSVSTDPDGAFVQLGDLHSGPNRVVVEALP